MNYQKACTYLESYVKLSGVKPGLSRIKKLLAFLGNPERQIPVIHIAGTNGKGSVTLFTSQALLACNYRVGTYLSPHLIKYNERFLLNGQEISNQNFAKCFNLVQAQARKIKGITEFEILTAMAWVFFKEQNVDIAVMETGLGGRYDATNVCKTICSIITPISFDHESILGNTLEKIAWEKAGIIKNGVPIISASQEPEALAVLVKTAEELEAPLQIVGNAIKFNLELLGEHQKYNAALAIAALQALQKYKIYIPRRLMLNGIAQTRIPGRIEIAAKKPLTILDVAHNPQAFANLLQVVKKIYPFRRIVLIMGLLRRKNLARIMQELKNQVDLLVPVTLKAEEVFSAAEIAQAARKNKIAVLDKFQDLRAAYLWMQKKAQKQNLIVIAGSFYLVGEYYKKFNKGRVF